MFDYAITAERLPKRISTDRDHSPTSRWLADLRVIEIEEVEWGPYAPVSPSVRRTVNQHDPAPVLFDAHVLLERSLIFKQKLDISSAVAPDAYRVSSLA